VRLHEPGARTHACPGTATTCAPPTSPRRTPTATPWSTSGRPTAAFDETWGKGFLKAEQFVEIVYASLKKKGKV
jgi:hypothetical protein